MAWSDFFNNLRDAAARAQAGATKSANDFLTTPTTAIRPLSENASKTPVLNLFPFAWSATKPQKKTYQQVYGFEQDKANYGNERNADNLQWRDFVAYNNDTGEDLSFSVGYDGDGRISGVRHFTAPTSATTYYGQDLVGDFFKKNFDRDATDYTVLEEPYSDDLYGYKGVVFDSKQHGEFVPSRSLSMNRGEWVPYSEGESVGDIMARLEKLRLRANTANRMPLVDEGENAERASNGTLYENEFFSGGLRAEDADFFGRNAKDFTDMLSMYSNTPDKNARTQLLKRAYNAYGSNRWFRGFLEYLAGGEEAPEGEYDYRSAFELIGPDVARAYDMLNPRA